MGIATNVYSFMERHENGFPWIYLGFLYIHLERFKSIVFHERINENARWDTAIHLHVSFIWLKGQAIRTTNGHKCRAGEGSESTFKRGESPSFERKRKRNLECRHGFIRNLKPKYVLQSQGFEECFPKNPSTQKRMP